MKRKEKGEGVGRDERRKEGTRERQRWREEGKNEEWIRKEDRRIRKSGKMEKRRKKG